MHRLIKSGKPNQINLVTLYLFLNPEECAARDEHGETLDAAARSQQGIEDFAQWIQANREALEGIVPEAPPQTPLPDAMGECHLPAEMIGEIFERLAEPTLQDAARIRRVCRAFLGSANDAFVGSSLFTIRSTSDLILLMSLDGSPLLRNIGSLTFEFGESNIVPDIFGAYRQGEESPLNWLARQRTTYPMQIQRNDFYRMLMSRLLLEFPGFLERNLELLSHVQTVNIGNGSNDWDLRIVRPLLIKVMSRANFPNLRCLSLARSPMGAFAGQPFHLHFICSIAKKPLHTLILSGILISSRDEIDTLLSWIEDGSLCKLRRLELNAIPMTRGQMRRLTGFVNRGCLPNLEELLLDTMRDLEGRTQFLEAVAQGLPLRRLVLSGQDSMGEICRIAREGGFGSLERLDARHAGDWENEECVNFARLHDRFPVLRCLSVSSFVDSQIIWLHQALQDWQNANLVEICGFDGRNLRTLRRICNLPADAVTANPHLGTIVEQARGLDRFDRDHAYETREMHWLLWRRLGAEVNLYAPHDPLIQGNTVLFPPLALAGFYTAGEVRMLLDDYFAGTRGPQNRIIIPLIRINHWTALIVDLNQTDDGHVHVRAYLLETREGYERLGAIEIGNAVRDVVNRVFVQPRFDFEVTVPRAQPGRVDCGPVTAANIEDAVGVTGRPPEHLVTPQNVEQLRGIHFRLLRHTGEELEPTPEFQMLRNPTLYNGINLPTLSVVLLLGLFAVMDSHNLM